MERLGKEQSWRREQQCGGPEAGASSKCMRNKKIRVDERTNGLGHRGRLFRTLDFVLLWPKVIAFLRGWGGGF